MDQTAENPRFRLKLPPWVWALLAAAIATAVFFGYGQAELLLEAANLRYCG
jgi:type VI protein secretion system component VasF